MVSHWWRIIARLLIAPFIAIWFPTIFFLLHVSIPTFWFIQFSTMEISKAHVTLLPFPSMGHMIPYLGLGKLFVTLYNFKVTIFLVSLDQSSQTEFKTFISEMSNGGFVTLWNSPLVDITKLIDPNATIGVRVPVMMREIVPAFRSSIATMKPRPSIGSHHWHFWNRCFLSRWGV